MELSINNKNITILIADDEPTNRLLAKIALQKEGYNLIEAKNGIEAIELAKKHKPDVILMDAMMPKMNGFEAIKRIKEIEELQNITILMITALDSQDDKVKAFEGGANDYLSKPFDMKELILRVRSFVKMRYLYLANIKARIDFNYNIPNMQALRDDVEKAKKPAGIFLQIRDFENIVYLYGLNGLKVIILDVLDQIKSLCEIETHSIYTISEDRFVVFWDNAKKNYTLSQIESYAKILQEYINKHSFGNKVISSDLKFNIVVNTVQKDFIQIGVLALRESIKKHIPYLIADYVYKEILKNVKTTMDMMNYISKAIKEDRIVMVYQPIYDVKTDSIYKYECLVRIKKEDGGLLSPFYFLDIAKQSDQYHIITKTVISKSFEYMKDKNYEFSINLSSIDIENKEVLKFLFDKLNEYKLHKRLIIELLEDEVIHNFEEVLSFIKVLKKEGVKVAIDDYGSGYSNLERIFQFEPDYIKIDGSIIKGIVEDSTKEAITKSTVYLAKEIGVKTIGEFVADEKIFAKCKEKGIDFLQGYYISPPKEVTSNQ